MPTYSDISSKDMTSKVDDYESIKQSILNIMGVNKKERFFNSTLGSRLEELLFEPIDDNTASVIYYELYNSIQTQEIRVKIDNSISEVIPDEANHRYIVNLYFILVEDMNQSFFIKRYMSRG